MSDQTQTSGIPPPPVIPGGEEVYDRIMSGIEPELTTAMLPTLADKYAQETQAERDARMERYKAAFLKYEEEHKKFLMSQEGQVRSYGRNLMSAVEARAGGADSEKLENIESLITNLAL